MCGAKLSQTKEKALKKQAKNIWGTKCKECAYTGSLKYSFVSEKSYKAIITECPNCGFLIFLGEDGKQRWVIRDKK